MLFSNALFASILGDSLIIKSIKDFSRSLIIFSWFDFRVSFFSRFSSSFVRDGTVPKEVINSSNSADLSLYALVSLLSLSFSDSMVSIMSFNSFNLSSDFSFELPLLRNSLSFCFNLLSMESNKKM